MSRLQPERPLLDCRLEDFPGDCRKRFALCPRPLLERCPEPFVGPNGQCRIHEYSVRHSPLHVATGPTSESADSVRRIHRVAARLDAGQIVQRMQAGFTQTPSGGFKHSGYGREQGIQHGLP
jgi:hypothetical protein